MGKNGVREREVMAYFAGASLRRRARRFDALCEQRCRMSQNLSR